MTTKKQKETKKDVFDFDKELTDLPYADFVKRAFGKIVDTTKIKNQSDLEKEFKKFMGE